MYRNTNDYKFAREKREKKRSTKPFIAVGLVVVVTIMLLNTSPDDTATDVQSVVTNAAQNPVAVEDHPLQSVSFPDEGKYAVGTLFEGVIKADELDKAIPIASITKVITSLVVLDAAPIDNGQGDIIELQQKDENYYWDYAAMLGTITDVTAGETMTQYDMLQTMLLASSNNISDTIVDHYFGSVDEYVDAANAYLLREGFSKTRVVDATGFKPGSVSTPEELIKLGQLGLRNDTIAEIVKKKKASIPIAGEIPNYNVLIDEPNVTGLKPGFTDEAGSTLLFSADIPFRNGESKTVIGVVLAHQQKPRFYADAVDLLDQMRAQY